jgi:uncharacterized protein
MVPAIAAYPHTPVTGIRFETEDGIGLEGEVREADGTTRGTAVLCHPHPRYGGSKDHPVLWALRNDLASRRGLTVLCFNFRGVMGSGGEYDHGRGELRDVAAAIDRVRQDVAGPTVLVGWSFGAWIALRQAVADRRVAALVLVAIPLARGSGARPLPTLGDLGGLRTPVLLVAGDRDGICPVEELRNLADWIPEARTLLFRGADHFFGRREGEVAASVGGWLDEVLPGPQ